MNPFFRLHLLVFPPACHICEAILNPLAAAAPAFPFLCGSCREGLPWKNHQYSCQGCGRPTAEPKRLRCPACAEEAHHLARVWCAFHYVEHVRRWILSLKFQRNEALAHMLGALLHAAEGGPVLEDFDMILPVPLHAKRLRRRGFNQAYLLAHAWRRSRIFSRRSGDAASHIGATAQLRTDVLQRHRHTRPQMELPAAERATNVATAFSICPETLRPQALHARSLAPGNGGGTAVAGGQEAAPLAGQRVLLMDDIMTTGATLNACAATLLEAGAERVEAFVLARA